MPILSVFDYSGEWSKPWADAGHPRLRVDLGLPPGLHRVGARDFTLGMDALREDATHYLMSHLWVIGVPNVLIGAPPCDCFTRASAWLWDRMDEDGRTARNLHLVQWFLDEVVSRLNPSVWAMENPPGRLVNSTGNSLLPSLGPPKCVFDPWQFGALAPDDPSSRRTKKTYLWGDFNPPELAPHPEGKADYPAHLPPRRRDPIRQMGSRNKKERARTAPGFAMAFYLANYDRATS